MNSHVTAGGRMIRSETLESGGVLRLRLDAPKANILDQAMIRGIRAALDRETTENTKLIVFEGAGRHFSFGASVAEHRRDRAQSMLAAFHGMFEDLARLSIPTCAVVRGQCLGGGLELAAWCTYLVCDPSARLGQPEIRLAVFPPMASILLPWRVGGGRALDLCISGRVIDAQEALRIGLVTAVEDNPEAWWRQRYAETLSVTSAAALRFAERAARQSLRERIRTDLGQLERLYLEELMNTHDANEGIAAFIEKRPARFENR